MSPRKLHGECITIESAQELSRLQLSRSAFLDVGLRAVVAEKVARGSEILFLGNDVAEPFKKDAYQLFLHGILPCGSKCTVVVNGVDPHADVRLKESETDEQGLARLRRFVDGVDSEGVFFTKMEVHRGKDFMHYDHRTHRYVRVYFRSLMARGAFISHCDALGEKTYSNDASSYYRVVSRGRELNLSGWNTLSKYTRVTGSKWKAEYVFEILVDDIEPHADDTQLAAAAEQQGFDPAVVRYENMIIAGFDIEMIPEKSGRFPDADKNPKDSIFMICMTYHLVKQSESLLSVCLTLKQCDPLEDVLIVHCRSEPCLLAAFARFMRFMQPDFITEFNGGGFDWRNVITKATQCGVVSQFLQDMSIVRLKSWEIAPDRLNRFHRDVSIKIGGATADSLCKGLNMQGFVGFDTLIVFKQLEPHADSHKLNECLRRCNLGSKDDMDVKEMFRIYREGSSAEMRMVAHYCFIDTFKLQQLLLKKNVVQDRREVANLSYTSIHDNFFFAGGSRMRNLLMNRGAKYGYFFDTKYQPVIEDATAKFPGAYVVPPIKGIAKPMLRFDEFAKTQRGGQPCSEAEAAAAYAFVDKHFGAIYGPDRSGEELGGEVDALVREYVTLARGSEPHYPVAGLDFASLYPSIIMTYNVSPEKLIVTEEYAEEVRKQGRNLQFVTFPFLGKMVKAWFVRHDNVESEYSVCGKLLIELFGRRAAIKKSLKVIGEKIFEMETEMKTFDASGEPYPRLQEYNETKFDYVCFDSKQKAVKVFMNTLYGEMGNFHSCICAVEVSASVTTMGRHNLRLAKTFVESQLSMKTYYGDSVVGDTPIMIQRDGVKELVPIEELDHRYETYVGGKECVDYTNENVSVMTETGYSKIVKVIRHRTNKKLFRVTTRIGSVIVTEDHSLLDSKKRKITPQNCKVGTELLHWGFPEVGVEDLFTRMDIQEELGISVDDIPNDIAFVQGFFFGDGRCGRYSEGWFALHNTSIQLLEKCLEIFNARYSEVQLKILDIKSTGMYKAIAVGKVAKLVNEWRSQFYSSRKHKKVPDAILTGSRATKLAFMQGYYSAADGNKKFERLSIKGQIGSHGLYLLLRDLGYDVGVSIHPNKPLIYRLTFATNKQQCESLTAIKCIEELGECDGYVYDLETESHHFAAGVGRMVVHNTDSLYVSCAPTHFAALDREYFTGKCDKIEYGTRLVNKTFEQIELAKRAVNEHLRADNGSEFLKMAYEEVLFPVAFLSKKKYYGVPHEENVDFYPRKLFLRGLEVVKRGSSEVLKNVINEVLRTVMDIANTREIIDVVKDAIERVFNTDWPIDAFAKTKVYRPDKKNISVLTMMERYRSINYPTIPEPNVRFKYVICKYYPWTYDIQGRQTKNTIGDCMELVDRVKDEGLEIDLEYYFDNELTGQFARLITFCKEFDDAAPDQVEVDTADMSEIELDALSKERYQRKEDALFKAAKRFVGQLAKEYSNAFVNKGSLFANTWREVCNFISARPDLLARQLNVASALVLRIFASSAAGDLDQALLAWATRHVARRYRTALTQDKEALLGQRLSAATALIRSNGLEDVVMNCTTLWKRQVVEFIRQEYDYDFICKSNLAYSTIWDVLERQELEIILRKKELFPELSGDVALAIIDAIARAVAATLDVGDFKILQS